MKAKNDSSAEAIQAEGLVQSRTFWVCVVAVCAFSLLSARLIDLHVIKHDELAKTASKFHVRKEQLPSQRGAIVDRNGELLAHDQRVYRLVANKIHLRDHNIACRGVAAATGKDTKAVRREFSRDEILDGYERWVALVLHQHGGIGESVGGLKDTISTDKRVEIRLKRGIEEDERQKIAGIMEEYGIHGVYFEPESRRFYPSPNRLTHVLGYTNLEEIEREDETKTEAHVGKEGVEATMNSVMAGTDGFRWYERDNRGREIAAFRGEEVEPIDGRRVRLTIDMGMQNLVEKALERGAARFLPEKISTIWMDPWTGEVLSMASRPDFDLNTREGERRNVAIADQYEPGSTFKIVPIGGALEELLIGPDTVVFCHWGKMTEHNGMVIKDHHGYGDLTTEMVVAKSSNIGAYKIAKLLGPNRLYQYLGYFGFGERTGIQLTGEAAGQTLHPDRWSGTSFPAMSKGYEVGVTPLQMTTALGVIANGGLLMKPRIIKTIESTDGQQVLEKTDSHVVRRVLSSSAAAQVGRAMAAVTREGGTGTRGAIEGYEVAGKTGTSRKYDSENGGYLEGHYVCSFMGFFPAENPRVIGIVVVDDPTAPADFDTPLYGGTVAAPIFAEMAAEIATYLEIPPAEENSEFDPRNPDYDS
ncbi:MAG: cell division protein FtsI/penicillin-binding protein 2 [Verrucomicrobiales bacterium]|jgi:cell division protein FtsI/penicillin-binding protein 2